MKLRNLDPKSIHDAFSPAQEIRDPHLFVGRKDEMDAAIKSLMNPGGFSAVFGLRGVGKSSIACQIKLIAEGNRELTGILDLERQLPKKGFNYLVHYIRCDRFIDSVPILLQRLLFGDEVNRSLFSLTKAGERRLEEFKRTIKTAGSLGAFGTSLSAHGSEEKTYKQFVSDDLIQQFRHLLGTIQRDNQDKTGLLILIDEFDILQNKTGFASIVKACSSDFIRFGIVGVATGFKELVEDHSSIGRQIDIIRVPLMPREELKQILSRAEFRVQKLMTFTEDARDEITSRAEGFPYFVHLLGKEAMLQAFQVGSAKIGKAEITKVAELVSKGRLSTIYDEVYHDAVKGSTQRELLLKAFAERSEDEVPTEPVYALAKELGVSNPSQLMKELTVTSSGDPVLTKVRPHAYRFTDPIFKVYAQLRHWVH